MVNIFTAVVIGVASAALGFAVRWLYDRAPSGNKSTGDESTQKVEHVSRVMYREPSYWPDRIIIEE
jgi:hypothetical protein